MDAYGSDDRAAKQLRSVKMAEISFWHRDGISQAWTNHLTIRDMVLLLFWAKSLDLLGEIRCLANKHRENSSPRTRAFYTENTKAAQAASSCARKKKKKKMAQPERRLKALVSSWISLSRVYWRAHNETGNAGCRARPLADPIKGLLSRWSVIFALKMGSCLFAKTWDVLPGVKNLGGTLSWSNSTSSCSQAETESLLFETWVPTVQFIKPASNL